MTAYRKKPYPVEAHEFKGSTTDIADLKQWMKTGKYQESVAKTSNRVTMTLELDGEHEYVDIEPGDYLIHHGEGRFFPCTRAKFHKGYEPMGDGEICQECDQTYDLLWHAPQPMWREVTGGYSGTLCPSCFTKKAKEHGFDFSWTCLVVGKDGVPTTNWWHDNTRDRLLMGEPDPGFHTPQTDPDDPWSSKARVPQGQWGKIAEFLGWEVTTSYPEENCEYTMPNVRYVDVHETAVPVEQLAEVELVPTYQIALSVNETEACNLHFAHLPHDGDWQESAHVYTRWVRDALRDQHPELIERFGENKRRAKGLT